MEVKQQQKIMKVKKWYDLGMGRVIVDGETL